MIPNIVKRAMKNTVTDIGQLTKDEKKILNHYVKKGWLSKGKGGHFPIAKTIFAILGFDFLASRNDSVQEMYEIARYETKENTV
jgi:hypothetical protein